MKRAGGYVNCEIAGCKSKATGRAGPVRVCHKHWMRWFRAYEADALESPSDHANSHYLDARLVRKLDLEINSLRPEAKPDERYALFSELYVRCAMGAREVYRLMARGLVNVIERPAELDAFTGLEAPADVMIMVSSEGERVLRSLRAQDRMIEMEESKQLRAALDARKAGGD